MLLMILAVIYNVFDSEELLPYSVSCFPPECEFIFVYQTTSNFGEQRSAKVYQDMKDKVGGRWVHYEPKIYNRRDNGTINETNKRQLGLDLAKELRCTHALLMDCDEMYLDFEEMREEYVNSGREGSYCMMHHYIGRDTYQLNPPLDWYVPFIHKINRNSKIINNYQVQVDQTRGINCESTKQLTKRMHHLSWVRDDIDMKIRNSSATGRRNDRIIRDVQYLQAKGPSQFISQYWPNRTVVEVESVLEQTPMGGHFLKQE